MCRIVHIKDPLLLIGKNNSLRGGNGFPVLHNRINETNVSLSKAFISLIRASVCVGNDVGEHSL